jgi:hypothetical protein
MLPPAPPTQFTVMTDGVTRYAGSLVAQLGQTVTGQVLNDVVLDSLMPGMVITLHDTVLGQPDESRTIVSIDSTGQSITVDQPFNYTVNVGLQAMFSYYYSTALVTIPLLASETRILNTTAPYAGGYVLDPPADVVNGRRWYQDGYDDSAWSDPVIVVPDLSMASGFPGSTGDSVVPAMGADPIWSSQTTGGADGCAIRWQFTAPYPLLPGGRRTSYLETGTVGPPAPYTYPHNQFVITPKAVAYLNGVAGALTNLRGATFGPQLFAELINKWDTMQTVFPSSTGNAQPWLSVPWLTWAYQADMITTWPSVLPSAAPVRRGGWASVIG